MDIRKLVEADKVIIGSDRVLKGMAKETLKEVLVTRNIAQLIKQKVEHYAKLHDIKITELEQNSEELGVLCKKPFNISIIGVI
ncbi:MAG: ribosomal L7Ae/L30e/S12e/Gadd45 family protein [Candidatus Woesearchaeota archaeon]|jgi:large subunit ribosomal protein L30e|nr:ribosomal L7Ae/L30e/S12e/Gadd45 family protein [Candidatus Woesearchaeota archaeon]MDP7182159.1 ribosomal L7Ae/L30e/S12e/Gadd45 family protein [Candidatus Woesearchaeota archaeon]MDP7199061.1 ribosomal L7Ae/L30e/S12e/Gadd45 family protein [Candidatus Woesearchaeota archaeon]MDP7467771.1 ribosomal L7Ae/L30e/S12e/Gadd45 family protein [Candidatus Woesearchaeota archaeon]MDP7646474.1 ribosomal L7Ae/L30e/S12e/Gadd45 family protein [Candidatus Woesearchaeota archaeon]|tara:strand:- start:155 stop:403 length:249 start_codon:yes stop_codon:yes gene_type:complete